MGGRVERRDIRGISCIKGEMLKTFITEITAILLHSRLQMRLKGGFEKVSYLPFVEMFHGRILSNLKGPKNDPK